MTSLIIWNFLSRLHAQAHEQFNVTITQKNPTHAHPHPNPATHQLPQVGSHGRLRVPLQQPDGLVRHDEHAVVVLQALLHDVGKVPGVDGAGW